MEAKDLMKTLYVIERASQGEDIAKVTEETFKDIPEGLFMYKLDDTLKEPLGVYERYILRDHRKFNNVSEEYIKEHKIDCTTVEVSDIIFKDTAKALRDMKVVYFAGVPEEFIDRTYLEKLEELEKAHRYDKIPDCPLKDLTVEKTDKDFKTLLALTGYPVELAQGLYEHYKIPKKNPLRVFENFECVDNRLIIPLSPKDQREIKKQTNVDIKSIVISTNPYDFYFCSYGNSFQSCFSLNSQGCTGYWPGYVAKAMSNEVFMVYATDGSTVKTNVITGHKFEIPQMFCRCWGYMNYKRHLMLDKCYGDSQCYKAMGRLLRDKFKAFFDYDEDTSSNRKLYHKGEKIREIMKKYNLRAYYDSLRIYCEDALYFKYSNGSAGEGDYHCCSYLDKGQRNFIEYASTVNSVGTLDLSKKHLITSTGVLTAENRCPITNLLIEDTQEKHPLSKYVPYKVSKLLYLTYIDGVCYLSESTDKEYDSHIYFDTTSKITEGCLSVIKDLRASKASSKYMSLKALKDFLKSISNKMVYDMVLLRIVEEDKVTFQTFKNVKGKDNESR